MPGPFTFHELGRRRDTDHANFLKEVALPACAPGQEPDALEVSSVWWNAVTNRLRIRTPTGDLDVQEALTHHTRHENGGVDEISVAGLSGALAEPQTPTLHAPTHEVGDSDPVNISGLAGVLDTPQKTNSLVLPDFELLNVNGVSSGERLMRSGSSIIGNAFTAQPGSTYRMSVASQIAQGNVGAGSFIPGMTNIPLPAGWSRLALRAIFTPVDTTNGILLAPWAVTTPLSAPANAGFHMCNLANSTILSTSGPIARNGTGGDTPFLRPLSTAKHVVVMYADVFFGQPNNTVSVTWNGLNFAAHVLHNCVLNVLPG